MRSQIVLSEMMHLQTQQKPWGISDHKLRVALNIGCGYAHSKDEETKDPAREIDLKDTREPGTEPGAC